MQRILKLGGGPCGRERTPGLGLRLGLAALFLAGSSAGSEVDRLLESYTAITSVTCRIRRTVQSGGETVRFLSRVTYARPDRLHVQNLSPLKRRIIADGAMFYSHVEGARRGFKRPISRLSEAMLISLRKLPGTASDHLIRLRGTPEKNLEDAPPGTKRVGLTTASNYAVLALDSLGRLTQLEFFADATQSRRLASYRYLDFHEAIPGVWIPMRHEALLEVGGDIEPARETVQVDSFDANGPIARSLFVPSTFFADGIDFVDDFSKLVP